MTHAATDALPGPESTPASEANVARDAAWLGVREQLHARGLRWTPQRRLILDILRATQGHVSGSEIVEACRARDPETTPSTVYRTLDVLEDLGLLCHSHGPDGREEFHVLPRHEHAHLQCDGCGASWEVTSTELDGLVEGIRRSRGFEVRIEHLTMTGRCPDCADQARGG